MFSIREVAELFGIEPSALRYYEECGLISDVERSASGQRIYTQKHINRLSAITCFKHAGMSISELKRFFAFEADDNAHIDDMVTLLEERHKAIDKQQEELEAAHLQVLRKLHFYSAIRDAVHHASDMPDWNDFAQQVYVDE